MNRIILFLIAAILISCNPTPKFTIEGIVEGGAGEMIYLEHTGLQKNTLIDSARINQKGNFKFRAPAPAYPDFYRLLLNNKQLHFAVDSAEMLSITASYDNFSTDYSISGSESNTDIQVLRKSLSKIQRKANQIIRGMSKAEQQKIQLELIELINEHKALARPIILKNPRSSAAYFAIFQQVNGVYVFSPYEKEDRPYCAAVATSFHTFMPDYDRTKNLYALVMDAIKTERMAKKQEAWAEMIANATTGYIDIALPDRNGNEIRLSSLQGRVILLDFSAYESRESVAYTFALRDLHQKYAAKGFEIYQVSLDRNKVLWLDATENLPWVCVRDENGPLTPIAGTYNITSLPTYFLITPQGEIIGRDLNLQTLEREINKHLP
jgi:peroxiredoxin